MHIPNLLANILCDPLDAVAGRASLTAVDLVRHLHKNPPRCVALAAAVPRWLELAIHHPTFVLFVHEYVAK